MTDSKPVLHRLQGIANGMMAIESRTLFVEGYNERTLLALYEITGDRAYLDHVRKWVRKLLDLQKPEGYWSTGYGDVYFADTGSALGLFLNFYKFATPEERKRIDQALQRYFDLLLLKGDTAGKPFVHEDGSLGCGFGTDAKGTIVGSLNQPYTISTALTGAEIFAAWHYLKGHDRDKQTAVKACNWILAAMAGDPPPVPQAKPGQIPYLFGDANNPVYAFHAAEPELLDRLWKTWPYDTSTYAGEGFIAAWTYIDDQGFRQSLGRRVKPHVQWLLRTQNEDGSWGRKRSDDQLRSHGVVNLLVWYYGRVEQDPRVATAIGRYCDLLIDEPRSRYLLSNPIGIALVGRALATILKPGVDCNRWLDHH